MSKNKKLVFDVPDLNFLVFGASDLNFLMHVAILWMGKASSLTTATPSSPQTSSLLIVIRSFLFHSLISFMKCAFNTVSLTYIKVICGLHIKAPSTKEHNGRSNNNRPTGAYEAACDVLVLHYLIYDKRNATAKLKIPPPPSPFIA